MSLIQPFVYVNGDGTPATWLTVAVTVIDMSNGSTATSGNCTEIWSGIYKFTHSGYDRTKDYCYFANAGVDTVVSRYQYAFNSSFRQDVLDTIDNDSTRISSILTASQSADTKLSAGRLAKIDDILTTTLAASGLTLTSGERTSIADAVQAAILNENDSQAIIQAIADKIAETDLQIGDITVEGIATAVWQATVRELTVESWMTAEQEWKLDTLWIKIDDVQDQLDLLERMQRGTLKIEGTEIVLEDEVGEIQRWSCVNQDWLPTATNIYSRIKS